MSEKNLRRKSTSSVSSTTAVKTNSASLKYTKKTEPNLLPKVTSAERRRSSTTSTASTTSTNLRTLTKVNGRPGATSAATGPSRQSSTISTASTSSKNSKSSTTVNGKPPPAVGTAVPWQSRPSVQAVYKHKTQPNVSKCTLDALPDEVILKILRYLPPTDLIRCSVVNKRWQSLTSDNVLWHQIYLRCGPKQKRLNENIPKSLTKDSIHKENWRMKLFSSRSASFDPAAVLSGLKKIDSFNGLPAGTTKVLDALSLRWVLAFIDDNDRETCVFNDDAQPFSMSLCVRWYSFVEHSLTRVKKLRIYAARPVLGGSDGKAPVGGPCRRSLVWEMDFSMKIVAAERTIFSDDMLSLYTMPESSEIMFAMWKTGEDLAFVTASLHFHKLVERSLHGSPTSCYVPPLPNIPKTADIDATYGLHGYTCTVELRNQRQSIWKERFDNLHCRHRDIEAGRATLQLIDPKLSHQRSRFSTALTLLWRTELFKGKLAEVCIADVTVLDEHGNAMWCFSGPARAEKQGVGSTTYEYDGEPCSLGFVDPRGDARLDLVYVCESSEDYFVTDVRVRLSFGFINRWFGTAY